VEKQVACLENSCCWYKWLDFLLLLGGIGVVCATYGPEVLVRGVLGDPVLVHVLEQIVSAEWFEERANA
jgi:hypothetical protein